MFGEMEFLVCYGQNLRRHCGVDCGRAGTIAMHFKSPTGVEGVFSRICGMTAGWFPERY